MPYARIDVAFLRDHFETVPEKERARAIAVYLELVLTSAELLLDGQVPQHVALLCAHKIGISRSRYGRSEVSKLMHSLASAELLDVLEDGTLALRYWPDHHSSRASVDDRRKQDVERKRAKRPQQTIPGLGTSFRNGKPAESDAESDADLARGRARTRSESKTETGPRAVAVDAARDDEPDLDAPSTNGAHAAGREPDDGEALDITYLQKITPDFEGIEP
jgi:hypothetical protein